AARVSALALGCSAANQGAAGALDLLAEMYDARLEPLTAREGKHLPGQRFAAFRGIRDRLDRTPILRIAEPLREDFGLTADDHQDVVEIVRDAARQTAE